MPTSKKTVQPINDGTPALITAALSLFFVLIPVVGLGFAVASLSLTVRGIRKYEKTKDGYVFAKYTPWSRVSGRNKAALILSMIGVFLGVFVTVFGLFFGYALIHLLDSGFGA